MSQNSSFFLFDYFSNSFLKCFNLDNFKEKIRTFKTWLYKNIFFVSFVDSFSNFYIALKNVYNCYKNLILTNFSKFFGISS